LEIKIKGMAAEAWISYTEQYKVATKLARLATKQDLRNLTYSDHEDFATFITIMRNKWAKVNSLGSNTDDDDFKNILLILLSLSWSPIVATCLKERSLTETISLLETWSLHFSHNNYHNSVMALQVNKPTQKD